MTTNLVRSPLFNDFETLFNTFNQSPFTSTNRISSLNYRVSSEEDSSVVEVEVPGVEPAEVKVKLEGRQLSVDTPKGSVFFSLGTRIDASNATANLKHGLLTIRIPKREATTVEVKVLTN
jgi:HSP20 family molecular chaperone IbpA